MSGRRRHQSWQKATFLSWIFFKRNAYCHARSASCIRVERSRPWRAGAAAQFGFGLAALGACCHLEPSRSPSSTSPAICRTISSPRLGRLLFNCRHFVPCAKPHGAAAVYLSLGRSTGLQSPRREGSYGISRCTRVGAFLGGSCCAGNPGSARWLVSAGAMFAARGGGSQLQLPLRPYIALAASCRCSGQAIFRWRHRSAFLSPCSRLTGARRQERRCEAFAKLGARGGYGCVAHELPARRLPRSPRWRAIRQGFRRRHGRHEPRAARPRVSEAEKPPRSAASPLIRADPSAASRGAGPT